MPYSVKHDAAQGIVVVTFAEYITGDDLRNVTTVATTFQKQTGVTRFLIDLNECEVTASYADIYELPAEQYSNESVFRNSRIAVILPVSASTQEAAQFYENACRNRGWNVQLCPGRQNALRWLAGDAGYDDPEAFVSE